jgi:hypothetical protein|tara:strand:- start:5049 stop:5255 length:207 start_codon:yes stop_codon:yes gene_type:complete
MAKKNPVIIRISSDLAGKIKKKTPGYKSWSAKMQYVYDNSLVKHQEKINIAGELIYGNKVWQKIKKKK